MYEFQRFQEISDLTRIPTGIFCYYLVFIICTYITWNTKIQLRRYIGMRQVMGMKTQWYEICCIPTRRCTCTCFNYKIYKASHLISHCTFVQDISLV